VVFASAREAAPSPSCPTPPCPLGGLGMGGSEKDFHYVENFSSGCPDAAGRPRASGSHSDTSPGRKYAFIAPEFVEDPPGRFHSSTSQT